MATTTFNKKTLFTTELDLNLREKASKFLHCEHSFVCAEIWTRSILKCVLEKVGKSIWTDRVGNKVLRGVNG